MVAAMLLCLKYALFKKNGTLRFALCERIPLCCSLWHQRTELYCFVGITGRSSSKAVSDQLFVDFYSK